MPHSSFSLIPSGNGTDKHNLYRSVLKIEKPIYWVLGLLYGAQNSWTHHVNGEYTCIVFRHKNGGVS